MAGSQEKRPLADVLKNIISGLKKKEIITEEELARVWNLAVGKKASAHTRPVSLRNAVLGVNVNGSSWLYELTLKKKEILKKLDKKIKRKKLKDIRFRIGEVRSESKKDKN